MNDRRRTERIPAQPGRTGESRANPSTATLAVCATSTIAASLGGLPTAGAQDDVLVQNKITVTGSRIKRVDTEGAQPISVISREDIDASGKIALADVLREMSFNSFGSFRNEPGSGAQSQAVVSLRGLGGQRTLVLIDGRRVTGSPTFNGGAAVNLNTIPLAAVERIEVLRDGASAIYGSDAIGGVVNIIMRKDYEGVHLSWGLGRPTQSGGDEDSYSIVGGVTGSRGNITFGFEADQRDVLQLSDRDFAPPALSSFGYPGSYFAYLTTADPRNPTGGYLSVGTFPDPRCPDTLQTPAFPDSERQDSGGAEGQGRCRYNYANVSSTESEIDTKSFFINANYAIDEDTTFFTRGLFTFNESFGRYAPTPFASPLPRIAQDNSNNPTNPRDNPVNALGDAFSGQSVDTDGDGQADLDGPFDLSIYYRNIASGPRDIDIEDTLVDYLAGVQGTVDWLNGMDWELGAQYSKQKSDSESPGLGVAAAIQSLIDDGSLDLFAVNTDTGDYDRGLDSRFLAATESAAATGVRNNETRIVSADFSVGFDALQLEHGAVAVALGTEYRDEDFSQRFDEQTTAGEFQGAPPGTNPSGARTVKALFGESSIPVLDSLDLTFAGRWEEYNDFGTTFNPKLSAAFRPLDSLLLRASWGSGFRAPSMTELYESSIPTLGYGIDSYSCANADNGDPVTGRDPSDPGGRDLPAGNPCSSTYYQNFSGGNRDLDAEESTNWTTGLVWNPLDDLSLVLDWYDIEIEGAISAPATQVLLDEELALRRQGETGTPVNTGDEPAVRVGRVLRNPNSGRIISVLQQVNNVGEIETSGLDIESGYAFAVGPAGDVRLNLQWTWVADYDVDEADGRGKADPRRVFDPDHRGNIGLSWALGDLGANLIWRYIASASIEDGNGMTLAQLDDMSTWDASVTYATPWNGLLTLGARNLFDEDPPTTLNMGAPFYSRYLHDVYGRVPYVRYEQDL